jgi:hypothetical protein
LAVVIVLFIVLDLRILSLARSVEQLAQNIERMETPVATGQMDTKWQSGGVEHVCSDTIEAGETKGHFYRRHMDHVAADLETHPMD